MLRKLKNNNHGMTLTELVIASALIGLVMMGVISADFAIRNWGKRIEHRVLAQQDLITAMETILKDAKSAQGIDVCIDKSIADLNCGVSVFSQIAPSKIKSIAVRQDPDITVTGDEFMYIYIWYPEFPISPSNYIQRCYWGGSGGASTICDDQFFYATNPDDFFTLVDAEGDGIIENIYITLQTRPDPTAPDDDLDNPTFTMETSFYPTGVEQ